MISETEAIDRILAVVEPLPVKISAVEDSIGHFSAEAIFSPTPLPRFDQSSMDGYAVRASDTPGTLRLVGEQPAGKARALHVGPGEAVRIFTGAPLPPGADAVVMQEEIEREAQAVRIAQAVPVGDFIRRRGGDLCEGQQLIEAGEALTPARIGLLLAAGICDLAVHSHPNVAIITTGDELRPAGSVLTPGELYDSNSPMLAAQFVKVAHLVGTTHTPDDPLTLADAIRSFAKADVIVLSAGVSVGEHDPVHEALRQLGAEVDFWRVAVKPGKPFLFGRLGRQLLFALPEIPFRHSSQESFSSSPALFRLAGARLEESQSLRFRVPLGARVENPDARVHYVRATLRDGAAFPLPFQQSHALAGLAAADVLLRADPQSIFEAGTSMTAISIKFR